MNFRLRGLKWVDTVPLFNASNVLLTLIIRTMKNL